MPVHTMVIIDDEYIVVEGLKAIIARAGLDYEIVGFAYDGLSGLEIIRETRPEIVITDIRIPGLDGLSLIEAAREFLPDTAFIVISGYNEFEYARKALSLGVKAYIDKPISIEKVSKVLLSVENERAKTHREFKAEEDMTALRRDTSIHLQALIVNLMKAESESVKVHSELIMENIRKLTDSLETYRGESFQFLCVVMGVFQDHEKQMERVDMVSYSEIKDLESFEKIEQYVRQKICKITEKLEAAKSGSSNRTILQLLAYINEHFCEPIGLNELAEKVKMNPAYLCILFKEEVGCSYIKYLTSLRIKYAKELLCKGNKVVEISEMIGYNDYRYFCEIFKKNVGMTPNEYKRCVQNVVMS